CNKLKTDKARVSPPGGQIRMMDSTSHRQSKKIMYHAVIACGEICGHWTNRNICHLLAPFNRASLIKSRSTPREACTTPCQPKAKYRITKAKMMMPVLR